MIAVYARVSTVLQIDNTSLDQQVELCKKLAYEKGFKDKDIIVYREEGYSGEDIDIRPVMMKLREDVAEGLITQVICSHPDRLSRDLTDKLIVVREFEKNGAEICFTDTEFEKSPEGILFFNIISAIASYELALIRKRTVRGRERAVRELQKIMPMRVAPFGYDKDQNGQLVVNTHEAQYVKMIYEWYVYENLTTREIGERLVASGVMPKRGESKNWSASSIGRILSSEMYIGNYYYNRRQTKKVKGETTKKGNPKRTISLREEHDWIHVSIPAIVDQAIYELAQKQKGKNITNKHVGNQKYQFLLKSLVKCGHCGRTWDATTYSGSIDTETGKRKKYRCYRCPNLAPKKYGPEVQKCPSQNLRAELLEDYIWGQVVKLVSNPDYFLKQIDKNSQSGTQELELRIITLEREVEQKQKEKEKVKLMFRRDVITEDEMVSDLKRLNDSIIKLEQELSKYQVQIQTVQKQSLTLEKINMVIHHIQEKLKQPELLSFEFKRHIIEMLFDEIILRFEGTDPDKTKLVITSVGAFDKLLQQQDNIGVRTQPQEIRQHRRGSRGLDLDRHNRPHKAIESFQTGNGTKLATFAARCTENEILMHLRSLKKTRKDVSLHDPIGTDKEGNEITLIDILGTETDDVADKVQLKIEKSKIYKNLDILDDREKEVVIGRFGLEHGGDERTQREIEKELGISRSYVSRIEKRALMKLYHEFYKAKK